MEERITAIIAAVGGICWLAAGLLSPLGDGLLVPLGGLFFCATAGGLWACILSGRDSEAAIFLGSPAGFLRSAAGPGLLIGGVLTMVADLIDPETAKGSRFIAVGLMAAGLTFIMAVTIRLRLRLSWVVVPLWIGTAVLLFIDQQAAILLAFGLALVAVCLILWRIGDAAPT